MTDVSKIVDNKQLVHIASEVVVLSGIVFYFSSKNKRLLAHIEELSQKIEEQEDRLQKFETSLNTLVQQVNIGFNQIGQNISFLTREKKETHEKKIKHTTPVIQKIETNSRSKPKVNFYSDVSVTQVEENNKENNKEDEELSDSDLDEEIQQELEELDTGLKET